MSTILYGQLTKKRQESRPGLTQDEETPGLKTLLDGLAAIVPAEVLAAHAALLPLTTKTALNNDGQATVTITDPVTLTWAFWGLTITAAVLYMLSHGFQKFTKLDWVRAIIPPLAFVSWTMLQKSTAFDAVMPQLPEARRLLVAILLALILVGAAKALADAADQTDKASGTMPNR